LKHLIDFRMVVISLVLSFACAACGLAQEGRSAQPTPAMVRSAPGTLVIPKSSLPKVAPVGHQFAANTNVQIFVPSGFKPEEAPPFPGYGYETPASIGCHYGLVAAGANIPNCIPNSTTANPTGGSKTIAIVDAYDDPSAAGDLAWFSLQFGVPLTVSQFQVIWANDSMSSCGAYGVPVDYTGGWEVEEALDVEWAHAMAPSATIYLVEACSNYDSDLQQAVLVANNLVQCGKTEIDPSTGALGTCPTGSSGKGEVSMSWGAAEYPIETTYDANFTAAGVVYVASSGDGPGVIYPCTSPNVVCAGGTTIRRNPSTFSFIQESAWALGGGGQSMVEKIPSYQSTYIPKACATYRCVPDFSFDSDPYTGVWVYDTFPIDDGLEYYEWLVVGGTSVAAPSLAGIINNASAKNASFAASTNAELTKIYYYTSFTATYAAQWSDITYGYCGKYMGFSAVTSYDLCTGLGVDKGYAGK
jgi:kumamolisin